MLKISKAVYEAVHLDCDCTFHSDSAVKEIKILSFEILSIDNSTIEFGSRDQLEYER